MEKHTPRNNQETQIKIRASININGNPKTRAQIGKESLFYFIMKSQNTHLKNTHAPHEFVNMFPATRKSSRISSKHNNKK